MQNEDVLAFGKTCCTPTLPSIQPCIITQLPLVRQLKIVIQIRPAETFIY